MSIQVDSITKIYGQQKALHQVSFTIEPGEIVGFLGPNGAGKSTMMKILTGYIPQSSGMARVCGLDLNEDSLKVRRKVGYLPESNPLYLELYVREYLEFMAGVHRISKKRIPEMIEKTGLNVEAHKKIRQLSKGYRQRVGLAAALLHDPEVLILDEPTTGLDPNQLQDIRQLIKNLGSAKTVMLSTHIMQEVEALCHRVIIINKGEIVADRPTAELTALPQERLVEVQFDRETSLSALRKIAQAIQVKALGDRRYEIQTRDDEALRSAIFQFAVSEELVVLEIKGQAQSLEQVFQSLTQNKEA